MPLSTLFRAIGPISLLIVTSFTAPLALASKYAQWLAVPMESLPLDRHVELGEDNPLRLATKQTRVISLQKGFKTHRFFEFHAAALYDGEEFVESQKQGLLYKSIQLVKSRYNGESFATLEHELLGDLEVVLNPSLQEHVVLSFLVETAKNIDSLQTTENRRAIFGLYMNDMVKSYSDFTESQPRKLRQLSYQVNQQIDADSEDQGALEELPINVTRLGFLIQAGNFAQKHFSPAGQDKARSTLNARIHRELEDLFLNTSIVTLALNQSDRLNKQQAQQAASQLNQKLWGQLLSPLSNNELGFLDEILAEQYGQIAHLASGRSRSLLHLTAQNMSLVKMSLIGASALTAQWLFGTIDPNHSLATNALLLAATADATLSFLETLQGTRLRRQKKQWLEQAHHHCVSLLQSAI